MPTLRLTQFAAGPSTHRVQVDLDDEGGWSRSAVSQFQFALSEQDREDLRWYLEDYLEYPIEPAPAIAARVEQRQAEVGRSLFNSIFSSDARDIWAIVQDRLHQMRVEVASEVEAAAELPWELIRDPRTDVPLALRADAFVRTQHQSAQRPRLPQVGRGETIRVLLVICRPAGGRDVPFRSVASHLVRLSAQAREIFQLDVLRPPTFRQLDAVLRAAARQGEPYHVVHFDGHGAWADLARLQAGGGRRTAISPLPSALSPMRPGGHGYLVFEDPGSERNEQFVDGPALGRLLVETEVGVLVLHACRSAHADLATTPDDVAASPSDGQTRVRAYGSLAQEVVDAGVAGVVAMRYNLWVVTAAQFIGDLYASLLQGEPLGEAVTAGRKQLAAQPTREIAFTPRPLQDWVVPVVYEAAPVKLFAKQKPMQWPTITLSQTTAADEGSQLDSRLPARPDIGFFGRDETLLTLDRAFDTHRVVLLHALAGAGKTTTAAEFARWYALTGGVQGPVLFTSFERYTPLARVLDQLGEAFESPLEANGIQWLALTDQQRRQVAGQLLTQVPVLWIWDNVEPVTGFPAGSESAWSREEQEELAGFLRQAQDSQAKVLLTSRRDEDGWLGELPARVQLPPMPMTERVQLARAIAAKQDRRLTDIEDWRPLLAYTQGNPLTITVLVGQALREDIRTRDQIEAFVTRLRAGEATLADDEREGRTKSLGASLGYGFEQAFTEAERAQLALLHLFQGLVDVDVVIWMGDPEVVGEVALATLRGLTREAGIALLDRGAEVGLLAGHGDGYYSIHPALPWYFQNLFTVIYGQPESVPALRATHAYTLALGALGDIYSTYYQQGRRTVTMILAAEEANLLHARRQARANGWWNQVIGSMQGLRTLYDHTGRTLEWARLVEDLIPDLVDIATDGPRLGTEEEWSFVTEYRIGLARAALEFTQAERLQRMITDWERNRASEALTAGPEDLDQRRQNQIRSLSIAVEEFGHLLRDQKRPECVQYYDEALQLSRRINDRQGEATIMFNLGHAHKNIPALRDLSRAESMYQQSLDARLEEDNLGRGRCIGQLACVAYERFSDGRAAELPNDKLLGDLNAAFDGYQQALDLLPEDAITDLAVVHSQLGAISDSLGNTEMAVRQYQEAIRYQETAGNRYRAGRTRHNVALMLAQLGRLEESMLYARAALRDLETFGTEGSGDILAVQQFIGDLEARSEREIDSPA
jgi:tetratricopeptide (TPR) repeat protein